MHENFQYEQTMNKAHLNKFNRHTGELMFSRAAMRQFHIDQNGGKVYNDEFNLAGDGIS